MKVDPDLTSILLDDRAAPRHCPSPKLVSACARSSRRHRRPDPRPLTTIDGGPDRRSVRLVASDAGSGYAKGRSGACSEYARERLGSAASCAAASEARNEGKWVQWRGRQWSVWSRTTCWKTIGRGGESVEMNSRSGARDRCEPDLAVAATIGGEDPCRRLHVEGEMIPRMKRKSCCRIVMNTIDSWGAMSWDEPVP